MRRFRIAIFGQNTSPTDGGSHQLLPALEKIFATALPDAVAEFVPIPWAAWSHRRRPFRRLWNKVVRGFGGELPLVDLRALCRRERIDVAYFAAPAFVRIDVPYVFTLWDIGHRTIPEFPEVRCARDSWTQREALCRRMLGAASFVVVGNQVGAAEVLSLYGGNADRVVPIPFPNPDFSAVAEQRPDWLPARPFFLYPAQSWPHKNHATLLRALAQLVRAGGPVPDLVFVGSDKGNGEYLRALAAELAVADRVRFAGFVSSGELKALYRAATGLVFPSLLGPNNLPPQEAAVLGCPMILSDLPGHREQMGAGALYAEAVDAGQWADAMLKLMTEAEFRTELAGRARQAVAGYTAENYAARLGEILTRLIAWRALWGK